ncbi:hypothetical protein QE363_001877 [Sphingomonas sp. SORGH_AS870]|nr:hypothetical protein [Sphingomonas sp. SORGH_AS_0870]MDR6146084.1 hypothetical protein [Sphingomonas sp. SORGH_AS_0870]
MSPAPNRLRPRSVQLRASFGKRAKTACNIRRSVAPPARAARTCAAARIIAASCCAGMRSTASCAPARLPSDQRASARAASVSTSGTPSASARSSAASAVTPCPSNRLVRASIICAGPERGAAAAA